jgi:hypothetical protein
MRAVVEPFLTLSMAFLKAFRHDANLTREVFLERVRTDIAEGRLLASGVRFWEEASYCPSGRDGTETTKYITRALEKERADILRRDMVDYRPIFERGLTGLIVGSHTQNRWSLWALIEARSDTLLLDELRLATQDDLEKRDGWADVQVLASDVERRWLTQKKTAAKPASDAEIDAVILAKAKTLGRQPTERDAIAAVKEKQLAVTRPRIRERMATLYPVRKQGPRA